MPVNSLIPSGQDASTATACRPAKPVGGSELLLTGMHRGHALGHTLASLHAPQGVARALDLYIMSSRSRMAPYPSKWAFSGAWGPQVPPRGA